MSILFPKCNPYIRLLLLCFFVINCHRTKDISSKQDLEYNYSKSFYESLGSNINRLLEMQQGVFVQYIEEDRVWTVNSGADSTIKITRTIGIPTRDGAWLLTYYFLSHAHELPLQVLFQNYTNYNNDRDRIICRFYTSKTPITWAQFSNPKEDFKHINFKELTPMDEYIIFSKEELMKYKGLTSTKCVRSREFRDQYKLRKDIQLITPEKVEFQVFFYKNEIDTTPYKHPNTFFLKKLPKNNCFYPNTTIYNAKE